MQYTNGQNSSSNQLTLNKLQEQLLYQKFKKRFLKEFLPILEDAAMYGAIMARDQHLSYTAKSKEGKMMFDKAFKHFNSAAYKKSLRERALGKVDWYFDELTNSSKKMAVAKPSFHNH